MWIGQFDLKTSRCDTKTNPIYPTEPEEQILNFGFSKNHSFVRVLWGNSIPQAVIYVNTIWLCPLAHQIRIKKKKKKGLAALLGYHLHTTKFPIGSTQLSEF